VLELLCDELLLAMALVGAPDTTAITAELLTGDG
jgi:hypothetical protein